MPPTTFGIAAGSGEDDDLGDPQVDRTTPLIADAESILDECVESGVDRAWLAWHYRSRDEVLIQFSNEHYYEKRLSSFPSPYKEVPGCGIEYIRVDGQFDHGGKRTNVIEAEYLVAEVQRRANDPSARSESIGIVTLNVEQRDLILEKLRLLDDRQVDSLLESDNDSENLFVLNLESVQGRERDVIFFGTSFSKRENGQRMPLQFGPLTAKGGERRLNVAVTRARPLRPQLRSHRARARRLRRRRARARLAAARPAMTTTRRACAPLRTPSRTRTRTRLNAAPRCGKAVAHANSHRPQLGTLPRSQA
jgi:hypothetical protein